MKKTKRILSALTALAITASAFASMVIPASADATTVYTADFSSVTADGTITEFAPTEDAISSKSVANFGTTIAALNGWGYHHFSATGTTFQATGRQTSASVTKATNLIEVAGVGISGCNGSVSFIPANAGITLASDKVYTYTFDAVVTSNANSNNTGSPTYGFTKAADGSSVDSVAGEGLAASGKNGVANTYKMVLVDDKNAGAYAIFKDGIRVKNGSSNDITGIYNQTESNKYIKSGISNLVITEDTAAPATGAVTFNEEDGTKISSYTVLAGTSVATPTAKNITGKTFIGWTKNSESTSSKLENVTVESGADDVYVATYREGADYSNIVVKSNPYAKVELTLTEKANDLDDASLTQEKVTGYTDGTGSYTASHVVRGTYSYTISKTGYTSKSDTFTLAIQDYALNAVLDLDSEHEGLLYYESDFVNGAGNFGIGKTDRSSDLVIPDIALDGIKTVSFDMEFGDTLEQQYTLMLVNSSNKEVVGLQGTLATDAIEEGLYAFTDFNGKDGDSTSYIHQGGSGKFEQSVKMSDTYSGTFHVDITFNPVGKSIAVKIGDNVKALTMTQEDFTISKVRVGKYRNQTGTLYIDNLEVSTPDPNEVLIAGDDAFAKIAGKTVTRQYIATPAVYVDGEEFTWTATNASGAAVNGVTIDDNGLLSVTDAVDAPVDVKIAAVSKTTAEKKGEMAITINDYATLSPVVEGPKAVQQGESAQFTVTKITDNYGDDVTEYFTPAWSIDGKSSDKALEYTGLTAGKATAIYAFYNDDNTLDSLSTEDVTIPEGGALSLAAPVGAKVYIWDSVEGMKAVSADVKTAAADDSAEPVLAEISGKTGKMTTSDAVDGGNVTVTLTLAGTPYNYDVKVDNFYKVVNYTAGMTPDADGITTDDAITAYQVTVADASGNKLGQDTYEKDATLAVPELSEGTPAYVEIAPVYSGAMNTVFAVPAERYNITVSAGTGRRTDVYVNDQMVINNLNQGDDGWNPGRSTSAQDYNVGDVVIAEGYAKFNYKDDQSGGTTVTGISFAKAPEIVTRAQRVYVVGDSLVATYYGTTGTEEGDKLARTGWGQVLGNYLKNVEVTNLGNSGAWATGMLNDAYTNIAASAQKGDIVIWESGYNDTKHGGKEPMKAAIKVAIDECNAKGIDFYLVTPNASNHDYKVNVESSAGIRELATETGTKLIDLSQESYDFFTAHYTDKAQLRPTYNNDADNGLHSSCNAANVFASIVAQGLYNDGKTDIVDTDYTYTFTDTKDTPETITVKVTPAAN